MRLKALSLLPAAPAAIAVTLLTGAAFVPLALTAGSSSPTIAFSPPVMLVNSSGASTNGSEPSIHIDSQDNVYVSAPAALPIGGCPFWSGNPDRGEPFAYRGTIDVDHGSIGGGDCDISSVHSPELQLPEDAPVPVRDSAYDPVSVTSLTLANLTSNVTFDGGKTFLPAANPVSQQIFGVDRQWQASDEALGRHYLTVHDMATLNIQTSVSYDGGYQYLQNTPAIQEDQVLSRNNHFGPTVVDQRTHKLYVPFIASGPEEALTGEHTVWVAEGDPCAIERAATHSCGESPVTEPIQWQNHVVFNAPAGLHLSNDFPTIAIDSAGTVGVGWSGDLSGDPTAGSGPANNRIFFSRMTSPGDATSWTAPVTVDPGTAFVNVFPWLVAAPDGAPGAFGYAWYTGVMGPASSCDGPDGEARNERACLDWTLAYASTGNGGTDWLVTQASPGVIHEGQICTGGLGCADGTRTMLDFFDVAADSKGRAYITYVDTMRSPGTADVAVVRQCGGMGLDGALDGDCSSLGDASATCPGTASWTDRSGDGKLEPDVPDNPTDAVVNEPALDLVSGDVREIAPGQVRFRWKVADLSAAPPTAPTGSNYRWNFTRGSDATELSIDAFLDDAITDPVSVSPAAKFAGTPTLTIDRAAGTIDVVVRFADPTPQRITTAAVFSLRDFLLTPPSDAAGLVCDGLPAVGPEPSPTPSSASPTPSATASPTASATATPTASPTSSAVPCPSPSTTPSPSTVPSPSPTVSAGPCAGGSPRPTPSPGITRSPSPSPSSSSSQPPAYIPPPAPSNTGTGSGGSAGSGGTTGGETGGTADPATPLPSPSATATAVPQPSPAPQAPPVPPAPRTPGLSLLGTPVRALDTRVLAAGQRLASGDTTVTMRDLPTGTSAVLLNITAASATAQGHVVAFAAGAARPPTSALTFSRGVTTATGALVPVSSDGRFVLSVVGGPVALIADLVGTVGTGGSSSVRALPDARRALDTRTTGAPRRSGEIVLPLQDLLPAGATGAVLSVTATGATTAGHVSVAASGTGAPTTSSLNVPARGTATNQVVSALGRDGAVSLWVGGTSAAVIVDVLAAVVPSDSDGLTALTTPARALDTRTSAATQSVDVDLSRVLPEEARAALVSVTVLPGTASSHVVVHDADRPLPATSNVTFRSGELQTTQVLTGLGASRRVHLQVGGTRPVHLIVDVVGWTG